MLSSKSHSISNQRGYILVGALAFAVIVSVGASMAILSAQQKVDEARNKEAVIEARLAMDSQASRILSRLDMETEVQGIYQSDDVLGVPIGDVTSGQYTAAKLRIVDTNVSLGPYAMSRQPLTIRPLDPLFPDVRMNSKQFKVEITAAAPNSGNTYVGTYTFQVRAIPIIDFALFNPGMQDETIELSNNGDVTDGVRVQTNTWAYTGHLMGKLTGSQQSYGPPHLLNARTESNPNFRLMRPITATGVSMPKWVNSPSSGFGTMLGRYDNLQDNYNNIDDAVGTYGRQFLPQQIGDAPLIQADPRDFYASIARSFNRNALAQPYQIVKVPTDNLFYEASTDGYIAMLNLGAVSGGLNHLTTGDRTILLGTPPPTNGIQVTTVIITNSANLVGSINLTFPPLLNVFFADHVNMNVPAAKLRIEGNIGFIPVTYTNVLAITNLGDAGRTLVIPFTNAIAHDIQRPVISVDVTNGVFFSSEAAAPGYSQLERDLYAWATNMQMQLISDPSSIWYIPNPEMVNYFLGQIKFYSLNETCKPIVSSIYDSATNTVQILHTNTFEQYAFGGYSLEEGVCGTPPAFYVLAGDDALLDSYLPTNYVVLQPPSALALMEQQVINVTNSVSASYTDTTLTVLHNDIQNSINTDYIVNGSLYSWVPSNAPMSAIYSTVIPGGDPLRARFYAIAWMSIEPVQEYRERFSEKYRLVQPTGRTSILTTNQALFSNFLLTDQHPTSGGSWYDYLEHNWVINVLNPSIPTRPSFRFNALGNKDSSLGAWKLSTSSTTKDVYDLSEQGERTDKDLGAAQQLAFNDRHVVFHYRTLGWSMTNLTVVEAQAPIFNGRLVVEDGIKYILSQRPTNLVVNGQVTYTHRTRPNNVAEGLQILKLPGYAINHTQTTYQDDCAERIYDVRIARVDTKRK